jgi:hypothetical protein
MLQKHCLEEIQAAVSIKSMKDILTMPIASSTFFLVGCLPSSTKFLEKRSHWGTDDRRLWQENF